MKRKRDWLIALCLLMAGGVFALGQQFVSEDVDVAQLRFNWPPGTDIEVSVFSQQVREEPGRNSDMAMEGTYAMRIVEHPDGILVVPEAFQTERFETNPPLPEGDPIRMLYTELGDVAPNYVVSLEGALLRVEGIEDLAAKARQVLQPIVEEAPEAATGLRQMVDQMLSEEVFFSKIEEQWNAMVGTWIGADFEIGAEYVLEQDVPSPVLSQLSVPMIYVFSAVERTACVDGGPDGQCVVLMMESYPDEEKLAELLVHFVDRIAEGVAEPNVAFSELHQGNTVSLVTDPDTLLPYEFDVIKESSGRVVEGGEELPFSRFEQEQYQFSYN